MTCECRRQTWHRILLTSSTEYHYAQVAWLLFTTSLTKERGEKKRKLHLIFFHHLIAWTNSIIHVFGQTEHTGSHVLEIVVIWIHVQKSEFTVYVFTKCSNGTLCCCCCFSRNNPNMSDEILVDFSNLLLYMCCVSISIVQQCQLQIHLTKNEYTDNVSFSD